MAGFDLDQEIALGKVDFGQGLLIDLELRVRGYLEDRAQRLSAERRTADRCRAGGFRLDLRIIARVAFNGQLLRWLLGSGTSQQVVAPAGLRHIAGRSGGEDGRRLPGRLSPGPNGSASFAFIARKHAIL